MVIGTRESKLCVASEEDEHIAPKTNATKAFRLKSCRSPGGFPQASRDSYLASCLHEYYFPHCEVRLDEGTGKGIVLVALKIASAQEDWRSNLCSHFQQNSSCCCDEVFTFGIGFRQQKGQAESDGDMSMTTTPSVVRPGLMSKKDRPRFSFSQELSYPRNQNCQQQALAK